MCCSQENVQYYCGRHGDKNGCRAVLWAREHLLAPAKLYKKHTFVHAVFFLCVSPPFLHVYLYLRQVYFCCSRLLRFRVVDSAGFSLCSPPFPPDLPVVCALHVQCFDVPFLLRFFFCSLRFLRQNSVLLFLPLALLVFCGPAGSAGSVCFCLFLLCSLCLLANNRQYLGGLLLVALCLSLFAFFLAGLLFLLLFCVFLLFVTRDKYRRPGPCGHSNAFLTCPPPYFIDPLRPYSPFMGISAPPFLCVCLLLVCMCVFGHARMLLGRAQVCLSTRMVDKCVC